MKISLQNAGKRFNREWVFRNFSFQFIPGNSYAITGSNGSGKSTLLQVIAGAIIYNEGSIFYSRDEKAIEASAVYRDIAIAAPYLELIEEMTATEFLEFHKRFKKLTAGSTEILTRVGLNSSAGKQLRYFSSGMKQRLKLAQAFYSESSVLLLDEPLTNLDQDGISLYHSLIKELSDKRLVIVSSNDEQEYRFCKERIAIGDYK